MALQPLPWVNNAWLAAPLPCGAPPVLGSKLLDAAADRLTFVGRFLHKDRAMKTVDGVGVLFGTIVKAAGSTFKISLQDVDLTTGPPFREDGVADQTLSIANADAGFVSNAWYEGAFGGAATRSVTPGDLLAIVLQFDTFVSADTVNIRGLTRSSVANAYAQGGTVNNLTGTYAETDLFPNVALRCTDGSYGTIEAGFVCSAITTHSFHLNTGTADEYAIGVQFPAPTRADALWAILNLTTATDSTELLLYSGTTALATVVVDHNAIGGLIRPHHVPCADQTFAANTLYRVAVRPTGTNNIAVYSFDVAFANHLQCHPGGVDAHLWTRLDQGVWGGEVTTRRLFAGVQLSAFDDGAGTGALLTHPGMQGGMRG